MTRNCVIIKQNCNSLNLENDINYLDITSKLVLFADDSTIYNSNENTDNLINSIVLDLKKISEWLVNNCLIINWSKTNALLFKHNQRKINQNINKITIDDKNIMIAKETRLLGVMIDDKHISAKNHLLRRFAYLFDIEFKTTLFKIFIQSQFDYCSTVFACPLSQSLSDRLDRAFSRSLRRYLGIGLSSSSGIFYTLEKQLDILKAFGLMPLRYRLFLRLCSFVYTVIGGRSRLSVGVLAYRVRASFRNAYALPCFRGAHGKYTVSTISVKILNCFIHKLDRDGVTKREMMEYVKNNLVELYTKCCGFWT